MSRNISGPRCLSRPGCTIHEEDCDYVGKFESVVLIPSAANRLEAVAGRGIQSCSLSPINLAWVAGISTREAVGVNPRPPLTSICQGWRSVLTAISSARIIPKDNCDCRKPKPKFLLEALACRGLIYRDCFMVGPTDRHPDGLNRRHEDDSSSSRAPGAIDQALHASRFEQGTSASVCGNRNCLRDDAGRRNSRQNARQPWQNYSSRWAWIDSTASRVKYPATHARLIGDNETACIPRPATASSGGRAGNQYDAFDFPDINRNPLS